MDYKTLLKKSHDMLPWLIEIRRDFHRHPETAMAEFRTRDRICACLSAMGIAHEVVAGTGVVGRIIKKGARKTIALRADIDALPMEDHKTVSYKSGTGGNMHACGHDVHTTILLGAGRLLEKIGNELDRNVVLLFQPAEETCTGAAAMVGAGGLENPVPDGIFALHVAPKLRSGQIGIKPGVYAASSDVIDIRILGKSSHGARPFQGVDAIVVAAHLICALQTLVSRNIDAHDQAVLSFGRIKGGDKRNIIAREVTIEGTLRTLSKTVRRLMLERLDTMVRDLAESFGATAVLSIKPGASILKNDPLMIDLVRRNGERLLGKGAVVLETKPSMGVEDFACYLEKVPGAIYSLGTRGAGSNTAFPVHTNRFDIDEKAMATGVALQVMNVLNF